MLKTTLTPKSNLISFGSFKSPSLAYNALLNYSLRSMASLRNLEEGLGGEDGIQEIDAEEQYHGRGSGRGGGQGSKKGARGGRGGRPMGRETEVSKALSKLLRHAAEEQGIKLDSEGYAPLEQVVSIGSTAWFLFYVSTSWRFFR
jgi:hypothetical protein